MDIHPRCVRGRGARSALSSHLSEAVLSGAIPDIESVKKTVHTSSIFVEWGLYFYKVSDYLRVINPTILERVKQKRKKNAKGIVSESQKKALLKNIFQM